METLINVKLPFKIMPEKKTPKLELFLMGGVVFYVFFRVLAFVGFLAHAELAAIVASAVLAGAVTGFELRAYPLRFVEYVGSAGGSMALFLTIRLAWTIVERGSFSLALFWLFFIILGFPLFLVAEVLGHRLGARLEKRNPKALNTTEV